jgi:hypothetical protein
MTLPEISAHEPAWRLEEFGSTYVADYPEARSIE